MIQNHPSPVLCLLCDLICFSTSKGMGLKPGMESGIWGHVLCTMLNIFPEDGGVIKVVIIQSKIFWIWLLYNCMLFPGTKEYWSFPNCGSSRRMSKKYLLQIKHNLTSWISPCDFLPGCVINLSIYFTIHSFLIFFHLSTNQVVPV